MLSAEDQRRQTRVITAPELLVSPHTYFRLIIWKQQHIRLIKYCWIPFKLFFFLSSLLEVKPTSPTGCQEWSENLKGCVHVMRFRTFQRPSVSAIQLFLPAFPFVLVLGLLLLLRVVFADCHCAIGWRAVWVTKQLNVVPNKVAKRQPGPVWGVLANKSSRRF